MTGARTVRRMPPLITLPAFVLMLFLFVLPAIAMAAMAFFSSSFLGIEWAPTLRNFDRLFNSNVALPVLGRTLQIAAITTAVVLVLSYPAAYWIATRASGIRNLLLLLILLPYWISYVVRTYAWYPLLGTNGVLNSVLVGTGILSEPSPIFLFSQVSVYLGLIYVWFPFATVPIYLALDRIDRSYLEASADLGASRIQSFWTVVLPLSMPGVIGGGLLVFILSAGSYVTPKLLGSPSSIMFGEVIVDQFGGTFDWGFGAALALALTFSIAVLLIVLSRWMRLREVFLGREAG
jgi:spermidine/putrescine transport system permease protein